MTDGSAVSSALTVVVGVVTGLLSAAFGVGGAVVSTPGIRLLGVSAAFAVGTTLPSILPGAVMGAARYTRESLVRWDVVAWSAGPGVAAAPLGAWLSHRIPGDGHWLMVATAVLLGSTSLRMARAGPTDDGAGGRRAAPGGRAPPAPPPAPAPRVLVPLGLLAGLLSGLLGVGGGIVLVPSFSEVARLPLKVAVATSLVCVGVLAVPATLTHWALGGIDWRVAALLSVGVLPGARLGAGLSIRASDRRLRQAVAGGLGLVAVGYLAGELAALAR